mgnify:CR=1 FL=1
MILGEFKLLAGLGVAAALLFAYQWKLHQAREEGRQECRDSTAVEYRENANELTRISARGRADATRLSVDAGAARSAADRLRGAVAGSGLVIRPAAAPGSAPASDAELLSAELLRRAEDLARIADERGAAGAACFESYEALRR